LDDVLQTPRTPKREIVEQEQGEKVALHLVSRFLLLPRVLVDGINNEDFEEYHNKHCQLQMEKKISKRIPRFHLFLAINEVKVGVNPLYKIPALSAAAG
jgi:hypothetical protein